MSDRKNQHYVPQFYLRNFSVGAERRQINLYNIPKGLLITNASLKHQASADYFYGTDGQLEEKFSELEMHSSEIIKKIILSFYCPPSLQDEHYLLVLFIITLRARTVYTAEEQAEMTDKFIKIIFKNSGYSDDLLDSISAKYQFPTSVSIYAAAKAHFLAMDLRYKVIRNRTGIPFLTSDNPVVYYNQFLETRKYFGCNIGIAIKGFQIFLPLSPITMIVFYDNQVYRLGSDKKSVIDLILKDDVVTLNGLQYLNAHTNLYFDDRIEASVIDTIKSKYQKYLRHNKASVDEYFDRVNKSEVLLHLYSEEIRCSLKLSFINIKKSALKSELGNKVDHIRNKALYEIYSGFDKSVESGLYEPNEFNNYLRDLDSPHRPIDNDENT